MGGDILITLQTEHLDFSERLAKARTTESVQNNRGGRNGSPIGGRAGVKYDIIGARGECASYLWASPVRWNVRMPVGKVADLDSFIDVKTRPNHWQDLVIQETDPDHWAYLLVCACRHPIYQIRGWCWGHEGKQPRFYFDPPGGWAAFFIKADDTIIKHPALLLDELRWRQQLRKQTEDEHARENRAEGTDAA